MSQPPDQPPPSSSPPKPKLSREERRVREADRLRSIRLRMAIGQELDERGITDHPAEIGRALGMPTPEADKLLTRHQWREGDVGIARGRGGTARAVRLTAGTPFARCTRCNRICGVMRANDARFGGWVEVLDLTCICGASADQLVSATQDQALLTIPHGTALAIVLVPDDWPGV